ncbi:MAG: hypothetical protein FWF08_04190 [Oscillospiraceae bacterium]|nr:hypothetical protein [Oscillospiraceae bacterium]
MVDVMTDKQLEFIIKLIADKIEACETIEEAKDAMEELKEIMKKEK